MTTSPKPRGKAIFHETELGEEKNGLRISPTNDDLPSAYTWGTSQISRFTGRSHHHDA